MNMKRKQPPEPKDLSSAAFTNPDNYREVFTVKDARAIILKHQGKIMACGSMYDIVVSKPQVGTVTITLKKTTYK